jgi:hypothetical protein
MFLSLNTVNGYTKSLFRKLDVSSREAAIRGGDSSGSSDTRVVSAEGGALSPVPRRRCTHRPTPTVGPDPQGGVARRRP